jgi:hypothetical protein
MTDLPAASVMLTYAIDAAGRADADLAAAWTDIAREIREGSRHVEPADRLTLHDVEGIVCAHGRVAVRRRGGPGVWFLHTDDGSTCDAPDEHNEAGRRRPPSALEPYGWLDAGQRMEDDPAATAVIADVAATTRMDLREGDTTALTERFRVPPFMPAEGEQLKYVTDQDGNVLCGSCPRPVFMDAHEFWRHILTGQRVCSGEESYAPDPGGARRMAHPRVVQARPEH